MRNHHQKVIVYLLIEIGNNIQNKLIIFYKINTKMINFVFSTINKTLETRLVFWNFLLNHWMLLLKLHTRISFHRTEVAEIASSIPDGQFGHNIRYYLLTNNQRWFQFQIQANRFLSTIICEIWIIFSWQI